MLVYLNSVILIYFLDHKGRFQIEAANRLRAIHEQGDDVVVSDLTRLECRVKPFQTGVRQRGVPWRIDSMKRSYQSRRL